MAKTDKRSEDRNNTAKEDTIDQIEDDIDDIRQEASATIRELKAEARSTGEKIRSTAGAALQNAYPADVNEVTRAGMYVGVGLVAAGLVIGVAALLYGKSEKSRPERAIETPEQAAGRVAEARKEAADKRKSQVIITPEEYQKEDA
ncbi:MAG: hypothetical protein WAM73_16525 [Desulfobacterales bacterium]